MIIKLGDICNFEKGLTGIQNAVPGEYPLVVTGPERKSCNSFQFDCEAVCIPLVSSTGHGHKSLNYIHYQSGKFALGTILVALTSKDHNVLNVEYLREYLFNFKDDLLVPLMKGGANVTLSIKSIQGLEIDLPNLEEQKKIIKLIKNVGDKIKIINKNNELYEKQIRNLRASILNDAIQGKYLPYSQNNKTVNKFTEQTSKDKIPFDLPKGWVWSTLGETCEINPRNNIKDDNTKVSFIPMALISSQFGITPNYVEKRWGEIKKGFTHFAEDDVVVAKITPCFENSKAGIMRGLTNGCGAGTTELHVVRSINIGMLLPEYIYLIIKSFNFLKEGERKMTGTAGQKRVPKTYIETYRIAIPPISDQNYIVEKVKELMSLCDNQERNLIDAKEKINKLTQSFFNQTIRKN